jgi:hypothetical protein
MQQRSFITLLVAIIVLGAAIGGALFGGIAIGKSQGQEEANQDLFSQFTERFADSDMEPGTFQPGMGGGMMGGVGGTMGTVDEIEGDVITLETPTGVVLVYITDGTTIQKMTEGSLDDILPGDNITVSGEEEDDGSIEATNIFIASGLFTE